MKHFSELYQLNENEYTEEKNGLTYLTWTSAWAEVKKKYPDAKVRANLEGQQANQKIKIFQAYNDNLESLLKQNNMQSILLKRLNKNLIEGEIMISDSIKNLERYSYIPNIQKVIDFLRIKCYT